MKKVTVVTPTYNRAHTLINCYESLKTQTCNSFLWLIIDDGSTDSTEKMVSLWKKEAVIEIEYIKKKNGGKASALNVAFDKVNTPYLVCLDSDDTFTENAIDIALNTLKTIEDDERFCGVLALRNTNSGEVMGGKRIPKSITDVTIMEITDRLRIRSEFIQFYITSIISNYRYPEIKGENFISSEYISREVNRKYRFKVIQEHLCTSDYLDDGLTTNKIEVIKKNPKGYTLVKKQSLELAIGFISKVKHAIMYIAGSILSKEKSIIRKSPNKLITVLFYPGGWLAYKIRFSKK